ncbi:MAG: hypothetical protein ACU843_18420, partial [Gammaproteobacteria bacterium]
MNSNVFRIRSLLWVFVCIVGLAHNSWGATINALSCFQSSVSSAISLAAVGDTVQVPAGSCTWSSLSIQKAITLQGAGIGRTIITLSTNNEVVKQSTGVTRISGFSFVKNGGGNSSKGWYVSGPWKNAEPAIFQGNDFSISNSGLFRIDVVGGVIIANNSFSGGWDDSFLQIQDDNDLEMSWRTADTLGSRDTNGKSNIYIENNTFYGGTNQGIDCSSSVRCVYRYNTLTNSSFNTHERGSLTASMRHFEVYNNTWIYNGPVGQPPANDLSAQGWAIWIRGASGVIFNNTMPDIKSQWWGDAKEYKFTIRTAEDAMPAGYNCANTIYPALEQLGQSHDGVSYFRDPIYLWNNTVGGNPLQTTQIFNNWNWGNLCGFNWNTFFQWGRDAVLGTAKPGYAPYPYPHPL